MGDDSDLSDDDDDSKEIFDVFALHGDMEQKVAVFISKYFYLFEIHFEYVSLFYCRVMSCFVVSQ